MPTTITQTAPECPWWCLEQHGPTGWDETGREGTSKTCRRPIPTVDDVDGDAVWIHLEQFTCAEDGRAETHEPVLRIDGHGPLTIAAALAGAQTLIRAAEMASEPEAVRLVG